MPGTIDPAGERKVVMTFKVTEADYDAITRAAKTQGMTTSDYIRASVLMIMLLTRADRHAAKVYGRGLYRAVRDLVERATGRRVEVGS